MLTLSVTLVNFTQAAPFVGAQVRPCAKLDVTCESPVGDTATTDADGQVSLKVPAGIAGFDGYLEVRNPAGSGGSNPVYPAILYLLTNVISDGWRGNFQLLSQTEVSVLAAATGTTLDPTRGHIELRANDCDLTPAANVSLSSAQTDSTTVRYYLINGIPSTSAITTDGSGVAAFVNIPTIAPASLNLVTGIAGNKSLGSVNVIVRPGLMTAINLSPQP